MALVTKSFSDIITFTRASTGTFFNSAGVLTSAAINEARFDYNPVTLAAQGLLIEEARTNSIRNNTMQGAVAGTPGTLPQVSGSPIWSAQAVGGVALTEVVGTGTENGITYIDLRYTGTTSSTTAGGILTESSTQITAASGQTWASSFYVRLIAGSTSGITDIFNTIQERDAAGALLTSTNTTISPTGAALNTQRVATTRTLNNASTARITQQIRLVPASGVAIDITLRIGLPQLEQGAFATSVIPTTTTALTRSTDDARVNVLSPWYNQTAGTLFVERIRGPLDAAAKRYVNISDGSAGTNVALQKVQGAAGGSSAVSYVAGVSDFAPNPVGASADGAIVKTALAIDNTGKAMSRDGGTVATSAVLPALTGMTTMFIGSQIGAGNTLVSNTWIRRITYYPRRLSNAELQAITV